MKEDNQEVKSPLKLTIHVGSSPIATRKEPIVHEKSVLKQLKAIIEKNNRLIEDFKE